MPKLKRCPFCGNKAKLVKRLNELYDVGCINLDCFAWNCTDNLCESCKSGYFKKERAIEAWNRRI